MGNSNTIVSNKTSKIATPKITPPANQIIFDAGDFVLCPSVGNEVYKLFNRENGWLGLTANGKTHYYNKDGKLTSDDNTPSLFHNTEANRQAIATLYQSNPIKPNDVTMPVETLKSIASEMDGASQALHDVSLLLHMIHQEKINPRQVIALARLSHDSTNAWSDLLYHSLESVNQTLASFRPASVGV